MLQAKHIHKVFTHEDQQLEVLKGIDLTVEEGEIVAVVGPSGAGKSTLLHILGGLDKPTTGSVTLDGEKIYELNDVQRARVRNTKIGFIFQFYHLLPEFTALENVLLPAKIRGVAQEAKSTQEAMELLRRVGLEPRASHRPNQLSGGEQQRVAIARSLINRPKVIFCDEPTGNLDSESGQEIIKLLLELNIKNKQTLVMVTHDENIAKIANVIIRIRDGQIVDNLTTRGR